MVRRMNFAKIYTFKLNDTLHRIDVRTAILNSQKTSTLRTYPGTKGFYDFYVGGVKICSKYIKSIQKTTLHDLSWFELCRDLGVNTINDYKRTDLIIALISLLETLSNTGKTFGKHTTLYKYDFSKSIKQESIKNFIRRFKKH